MDRDAKNAATTKKSGRTSPKACIRIGGSMCSHCGGKHPNGSGAPLWPALCHECYGTIHAEGFQVQRAAAFPGELHDAHSIVKVASYAIEQVTREVRAGRAYFGPATKAMFARSYMLLEKIIAEAMHAAQDLERAGFRGVGGSTDEGAGVDDARRTDAPPPVVLGQGAYEHAPQLAGVARG